jgi:hypothetical protein
LGQHFAGSGLEEYSIGYSKISIYYAIGILGLFSNFLDLMERDLSTT